MTLDSYSLCPCGSGKKLKFCCSDLSAELTKLARMIEGGQYAAALEQVERDKARHPGRACLSAIEVQLLRAVGESDRVSQAVEVFRRECPDNSIALAESAIQKSLQEDTTAAMSELQASIENVQSHMFPQVYDAFSCLANMMAEHGKLRSARALFQYQAIANPEDREPLNQISRLFGIRSIPTLMKTDPTFLELPENAKVEWRADYQAAVSKMLTGCWAAGERMLTTLTDRVGDHLVLWQNLATVRGWLGDDEGEAIAWEKAASLTDNQEDAAEYLAMSRMLSSDPLEDTFESLKATFTIDQVDDLTAALTMWKQAEQVPFDPRRFEEGTVPPKAVFWLLDREILKDAAEMRIETLPRVCGQALLFGRQTDREARLELFGVARPRFAALSAKLKSVNPDCFADVEPELETLAKISATFDLLDCPWKLPENVTIDKYRETVDNYVEWAMLERWPQMRLGFLDGKTPSEVAGDAAYRVRLLAAILVLEALATQARKPFDFNRLRETLGLPTLGTLDPTNLKVGELSLLRLGRLDVSKMTDDQVQTAYMRASIYGLAKECVLFGERLLTMPGVDAARRQHILLTMTQYAESTEKALEFIDRGIKEAEKDNIPTIPWKLTELKIRITRRDRDQVLGLIREIESKYSKNANVMNALAQILHESGLLDPMAEQMSAMEEDMPAEDTPSGLWTPDGSGPAASAKDSPSKLWVPGMD